MVVVRHAHAGERSAWIGDDRVRPLSPTGRTEAEALVDRIVAEKPTKILSSMATRCLETVEPLARKLDRQVETEPRLFEGTGLDDVAQLVSELDPTTVTVLCTHGDIVPRLLEVVRRAGVDIDEPLQWPKASVWILRRNAAGWDTVDYVAPPVAGC